MRPNKDLYNAIYEGRLDAVAAIIEETANIPDDALVMAVEQYELSIAQYLIDHGANINAIPSRIMDSAVINGEVDVVSFLNNITNISM